MWGCLTLIRKKKCMTEGNAATQRAVPIIKDKIGEWLKKNNPANKRPQ